MVEIINGRFVEDGEVLNNCQMWEEDGRLAEGCDFVFYIYADNAMAFALLNLMFAAEGLEQYSHNPFMGVGLYVWDEAMQNYRWVPASVLEDCK